MFLFSSDHKGGVPCVGRTGMAPFNSSFISKSWNLAGVGFKLPSSQYHLYTGEIFMSV